MRKIDKVFVTNFVVAILFIGGMTIIFFNAVPEFEEAHLAESKIPQTEQIPQYDINKPITLNLFPNVGQSNATDLRILITFDQSVIYAGDIVDYHARAVSDEIDNTKGIAIIFDHRNIDYSNHNLGELFQEIVEAREFGQVIELIPDSDPPFSTKGKMPFTTEKEVFVTGFIIREKGFEILNLDEPITKVFPISQKFEVEANRALLAQAEQQRINSLVQSATNGRLLALTWVGVGAVPIVIAADILIRVYLRSSEVNQWFNEKRKKEHEHWDKEYRIYR